MAIKMRKVTQSGFCDSCDKSTKEVLDMYEVMVGDISFILCDECNKMLMQKTLKADCLTNSRTKDSRDTAIISKRNKSRYNKIKTADIGINEKEYEEKYRKYE